MPKFTLTDRDGTQYDVEAPDADVASSEFQKFRQQNANQALVDEANQAPEWAKPFMAARDVGTVMGDTATLGFGTKLMKSIFGGEPEMDVAARRNRMGWAAPAADVVTAAGALPSIVPKVAGILGGGKLMRGAVGTTAGTTAGALHGGLSAAGHDEDVATGAGIGAVGGAAGSVIAPLANKAYKVARGIDDSVPAAVMPTITKGQKPTAGARIDAAEAGAVSRAGVSGSYEHNVRDSIEKLLTKQGDKFNPETQSLMRKVVDRDPASILASNAGNKMLTSNALLGGSVGAGLIHPALAMVAPAAMAAGGLALKGMASGGTREAMTDLRRSLLGKPKYQGVLSAETGHKISRGQRQGLLEAWDE